MHYGREGESVLGLGRGTTECVIVGDVQWWCGLHLLYIFLGTVILGMFVWYRDRCPGSTADSKSDALMLALMLILILTHTDSNANPHTESSSDSNADFNPDSNAGSHADSSSDSNVVSNADPNTELHISKLRVTSPCVTHDKQWYLFDQLHLTYYHRPLYL